MQFQLKRRFLAQEASYGTFIFSSDPATTEIAGKAGFDFVILDREHTALSWREITGHIRAADAVGISTLVRVRGPEGDEITHALDVGAEGVLIPHFGIDREKSADCVRSARFAPAGDRGTCTGTRAASFSLDTFSRVVEQSNSEALVIAQIEDAEILPDLDQLLSTIPVDAVMPGLADLSTSLGLPGQFSHPDVLAASERVFASAAKAKLPLGLYIANAGEVPRWKGRDCKFFVYAIDYKVIAEGYQAARRALGAA